MTKQNIKSLDLLPCRNSGLDELLHEEQINKDYLHYLGQFLRSKHQELHEYLEANPHLISTSKIKALFLLNLLVLGQEIKPWHISIRQPNPVIVDSLAYELIELYALLTNNIVLKSIDFYHYKILLPSIVIYYSDFLLKNSSGEALNEVYKVISDAGNFTILVDESLIAQQQRLLALYYRRIDNKQLAEQHQAKYREAFYPKTSQTIKLNKIAPEKFYSAQEVLPNLSAIYQEVKTIQAEVLIRSGVYEDTCSYFGCSDCCKKDFPTVSLTEFLHILEWIKAHDVDIKSLVTRAQAIQKQHKDKYGEAMIIVDQVVAKDNPHAFQFTCPMLGDDDLCTIHEARPLACRSFGLSTINGQDVQACKFYLTQFQYNSSQRNERDVYDSQPHTAMIGSSNELLAKQYGFADYKQPVGTLVAWLTCAELMSSHLE